MNGPISDVHCERLPHNDQHYISSGPPVNYLWGEQRSSKFLLTVCSHNIRFFIADQVSVKRGICAVSARITVNTIKIPIIKL